jgi:hypothetical protein
MFILFFFLLKLAVQFHYLTLALPTSVIDYGIFFIFHPGTAQPSVLEQCQADFFFLHCSR